MMDLFNNMTDDQIALFGCVTALLTCGLMMSLSFYIGQFFNQRQTKRVIIQNNNRNQLSNRNQQRNMRTGKAA